jgi:hypothetical protein
VKWDARDWCWYVLGVKRCLDQQGEHGAQLERRTLAPGMRECMHIEGRANLKRHSGPGHFACCSSEKEPFWLTSDATVLRSSLCMMA